jgi:hypothetical protein
MARKVTRSITLRDMRAPRIIRHTIRAGRHVIVFGDPIALNPSEVRRLRDWLTRWLKARGA